MSLKFNLISMHKDNIENVLLYGASYPDTIKIIEQYSLFNIIGIIDDTKELQGKQFLDYRIVGGLDYCKNKNLNVVNNIFKSTKDRYNSFKKLKLLKIEIKSVLPPSINYSYVKLGLGVCINTGVKLGARSVIGDNVAIRYNSIVNHDNYIGSHVFIGAGVTLCGNVNIGEFSYIGAGSVILPNITIGKNVMVGAGSIITKDVDCNEIVYGNPAIKRNI